MAITLKPEAELTVAALTAGTVYSIFQVNAPGLADVFASQPNNSTIHTSVKSAVWTSAAVVCGLSLLARSPLVFIVGSVVVAGEGWKYFAANATNPATGRPETMDESE